jgi:hypothetical protein
MSEMNPAVSQTNAPSAASRLTTGPKPAAVHATLRRDIAAPLAVLRASMEALSVDFDGEDPRGTILEGALEQIVLLGRNVHALVDFAMPPELHPLSCTLEELVRTAHDQLDTNTAQRVFLACEDGGAQARVDGALFTRSLNYLLSVLVGEADEAVLHASADAECLMISLLIHPRSGEGKGPVTHAQDQQLVLMLAERELERMGGGLNCTLLPSQSTSIVLTLPREAGGAL